MRHIAPTALLQLQGYDWPGNVLERVIVTATRKIIDVQGLPEPIREALSV